MIHVIILQKKFGGQLLCRYYDTLGNSLGFEKHGCLSVYLSAQWNDMTECRHMYTYAKANTTKFVFLGTMWVRMKLPRDRE